MENKIDYPICPMNMYFESDKGKTCDPEKCDFDLEWRCCCEGCKIIGTCPNKLIQGL